MLIKQLFADSNHGLFYSFCIQTQPQTYLKNCVFVSNKEFYLTLTLFLRMHKFHFVNNSLLFFTIHSKMWHKTGRNQIPVRGLGIYVMKIESTAVEMFWIAGMLLFWANMGAKCREKEKNYIRLKKQLIKIQFYIENWIFKAWMAQIRATIRE